ncbi:MAG: transporter substrate-binding domain-containing protein [Geminicoccaceae bacterium]
MWRLTTILPALLLLLPAGPVLLAGSLILARPGLAAPLDRGDLRIAVETNQPPFSDQLDDGSWAGFNIDVARALCERLRTSCSFVPSSIVEFEALLRARAADMAPGIAITANRRQNFDFTAPYYAAPSRFVAPRGRALDISPTGLAGKIVGVQRGTTQAAFAAATYAGVELRQYADRTELYLDLALGRLDAVLANEVVARAQFLTTPLGANFDFVGPVLDDPAWFGEGVGIAIRKGDTQLLAALDEALQGLRADGTFEAIRAGYFTFQIEGD